MHAKSESTSMQMLQNLAGLFISRWNARRTVHIIVARSMCDTYRIGMFRAAGGAIKVCKFELLDVDQQGRCH